ncbi:MAG: TrkH family potassium uptake protein [Candidatus Omnitrophica bacterium]|nr:TrkH family potassium uptake protein [Candidatus Omnitrophota bacterium]
MHKRFVVNITARIVFFVSLVMLIPLLWGVVENSHSLEVKAFMETILIGTIGSGIILLFFRIPKETLQKINTKDGLAIVGFSWICLSALGALPLYLSHVVPSYTDAFFEIVSGFTTTGATIFTDIEALPKGILFWRSLTHWLGGMGIIVLYIALLPALGGNTYQLYKAEAPGLTVERVEPSIRETAKNLWTIYFTLSIAETLLLMLFGMSLFDALCHTFGTMATGGFSTKNASVAAYGPGVQWVIIVFMFLAGMNFIFHYQIAHGQWKSVFKNEEFRYYSGIILVVSVVFSGVLFFTNISDHAVRESIFQVVSILTTTGFTTADFSLWPYFEQFVLVVLMFIGGCGGSTGGGMKIVRIVLSTKIAARSVIQTIYPNAILPIKFNKMAVPDRLVIAVSSYFIVFLLLFFMGSALLCLTERCDILTAITAAISALGNIGPGLGDVGPIHNYGWVSHAGKWVLVFLMLAGRLELYSILILLVPSTWKK